MSVLREGIYTRSVTDKIGFGVTLNNGGSVASVTGATLQTGAVDPSGGVNALPGSLYLRSNGTLYVSNGGTSWTPLGGASGASYADDVEVTWGTTSPSQGFVEYNLASGEFVFVTRPVSQATSLASSKVAVGSGAVTITGAVVGGRSGDVTLYTGATDATNAGATAGDSGDFRLLTGNATSTAGTSGKSGSILFTTGNSEDAASGDITLTIGTAGGARGSIIFDGPTVQSRGRLTTTDGVSGGTARVVGGLAYRTTADSTTITNTMAETAFSTGAYTIPSQTLKVGSQIRYVAYGRTPNTNATDTLTITARLGAAGVGGQVVSQTSAVDVNNGDIFRVEGLVQIQTTGAGGTMSGGSRWVLGAPNVATVRAGEFVSLPVDTTVNRDLTVTATWSAANPNNQAILTGMAVWID